MAGEYRPLSAEDPDERQASRRSVGHYGYGGAVGSISQPIGSNFEVFPAGGHAGGASGLSQKYRIPKPQYGNYDPRFGSKDVSNKSLQVGDADNLEADANSMTSGKKKSRSKEKSSIELKQEEEAGLSAHIKYDLALRFDASLTGYLIHPFHPAVVAWHTVMIFLLIIDITFVPYEVAFLQELDQNLVLWVNLITGTCFALDIVLNFFLQVISPNGDYWVFNHWRVIQMYLHGFFLIDLLSIVPMELFENLFSISNAGEDRSAKKCIFQLLRMIKVLKIFRWNRLTLRYVNDVHLTYHQRAALTALIMMGVTLHLMSCIWATLGEFQVGQDWLSQLAATKGGHHTMAGFYESLGTDEENSLVTYLTSIYFALYTLTGIGYGDINPTTYAEYIVGISLMIGASLVWAMIIGEIVSVLTTSSPSDMEYNVSMDALLEMTHEYKITVPLQRKLRTYLVQARDVGHSNFVQENLVGKMSPDLATQVAIIIHGDWIEQLWWLKKFSKSFFIVSFCLAMDPILYAPTETIPPKRQLNAVCKGFGVCGGLLIRKGSVWGADLMLEQAHLRKDFATLALSFLHVLYLSKDGLDALLREYPQEKKLIRKSLITLVLMRGMVYRAQQELGNRNDRRQERTKSFLGALTSQQSAHEDTMLDKRGVAVGGIQCTIGDLKDQVKKNEEKVLKRMERLETVVGNMAGALNQHLTSRGFIFSAEQKQYYHCGDFDTFPLPAGVQLAAPH